MPVRLFLLFILFALTTSFFWEDEEKQLRQLHQNGEAALQKRDFAAAKKAFEDLFGRICVRTKDVPQKYAVDWATYVDIATRLALSYEELGEKEEAQKILTLLVAKNPPEELLFQVKLMKARLSATNQSPGEAYRDMQQLAAKLPLEMWPLKERSFFHALEHSLNVYYDELIHKAKRFLSAGCYTEAVSLYEDVLSAIEQECYPKVKTKESLLTKMIRYRLAESHFLAAEYDKSLLFCSETSAESQDRVDREMIYLSALCYREKNELEKAVDLFQNYAHLGDREDLQHYDHALFEIGYYSYQKGQLAKARRYLERVRQEAGKPALVAQIVLARMALDEGKGAEVTSLLVPVMPLLGEQDPLLYECYYLKGRAAFHLKEYEKAKELFEKSLPEKNSPWHRFSCYHLGWCYLHLGEAPQKSEEREKYFQKAASCFESLLPCDQNEAACLALAQLYVLRQRLCGDQEALEKLQKLLHTHEPSFSLAGREEALLLQAQAASSFEEKEQFYAEATSDTFRYTPLFAHGWYGRGLNYFQEGLKQPQADFPYFDLATAAFEKSFRGVEPSDRSLAATILKLEAKANLCRNSPVTSLALLEKLLTQFEESREDREETLYLRGLLACQLSDSSYFPAAEESLTQVIEGFPQGKYIKEALYTLGTLYYRAGHYTKAQQTFINLSTHYPHSSYAPEGWFWAAEAALRLGENPFSLRQHVYEEYPESELAAEAFFKQYPYAHYFEGGAEEIAHLKAFTHLFPHSPLRIVAYFLLGCCEKQLEGAKEAFAQAMQSCQHYVTATSHPESAYIYFYYQAILELASRYLAAAASGVEWEECEKLLGTLVTDFQQKEHPLASLLVHNSSYHPLWEEGEFKLVLCLLKQGRDINAQKLMKQMLSHYAAAGIQEGYYFALMWEEQGKLAMRKHDYLTASACFEIAQRSGTGFISAEQKLSLWLLQSDVAKEKKEYGLAMRLLSKVINDETASPLRLKAMYLRAEIYELEGRPELAIRQLEATAKKGGEWATLAKEKLRIQYDIR